jgi:hypothetical protein
MRVFAYINTIDALNGEILFGMAIMMLLYILGWLTENQYSKL